MIECCIEDASGCCILCLDAHLRQLTLPLLCCCSTHSVEVPCRNLTPEVLLGILNAHCRETHLDHHRHTVVGCLDECHTVALFRAPFPTFDCHSHRLGKFSYEVDSLILCPTSRVAIACHGGSILLLSTACRHLVPPYSLVQVEQYLLAGSCCREIVSMHSATCRRRQFHTDATIMQVHRVVAWPHLFVLMGKGSRLLGGSSDWQQCNVAQFADASTTEVHVSKTYQHRV